MQHEQVTDQTKVKGRCDCKERCDDEAEENWVSVCCLIVLQAAYTGGEELWQGERAEKPVSSNYKKKNRTAFVQSMQTEIELSRQCVRRRAQTCFDFGKYSVGFDV